MKIVSEQGINGEYIAAQVIDKILSSTEHNLVTLSDILGISLKKLVLKKGFSNDELLMIVNLGSSLFIN
ncbi:MULTISPECIES: hypothetical protein [Legionella]|uniref:Uncharacterized protein n=2 Tax=Legionella TaxID=445 RepID=A0A0W0S9S7_9GAMM|nr:MULTISPECIES: hypothetical protein [Legionella]KTC80098.1 hypothetical protein Lche_2118 [Legionella cherrii]MCL9682806.1 hypothetical protein [Legionella maioricensis]MCL9686566.1 hypothetical protein [Legionella maioricensis]